MEKYHSFFPQKMFYSKLKHTFAAFSSTGFSFLKIQIDEVLFKDYVW